MNIASPWQLAEPNLSTICQQYDRPLDSLASGDIPAIVLRQFVPQVDCCQLIQRCIGEGLLYDPQNPVSLELDSVSVPEGHYREGKDQAWVQAWAESTTTGNGPSRRIDIGTSLGYRGSDQEGYFEHSAATVRMLARLFEGMVNLVDVMYHALQSLSIDKQVMTARENDGRGYGPAIIRAHYGGYEYKPHFDSVRNRENRTDYSVYDFDHQFGGILVLQNAELNGTAAQARIHRCFWEPEVTPHLENDTFHDYARTKGIESCDVILDPGDLYFFNTGCIHEVPGVDGDEARIVLAVFIGYSSDRDVIQVWS
jgi:hypothetical protein